MAAASRLRCFCFLVCSVIISVARIAGTQHFDYTHMIITSDILTFDYILLLLRCEITWHISSSSAARIKQSSEQTNKQLGLLTYMLANNFCCCCSAGVSSSISPHLFACRSALFLHACYYKGILVRCSVMFCYVLSGRIIYMRSIISSSICCRCCCCCGCFTNR